MTIRSLLLSALVLLSTCNAFAQTDKISSVSISGTGAAIVTERIGTALNQAGAVRNDIAGLQFVPGQIPLTGSPASIAFFTLSSAAIPSGGVPATSFTSYGTLISPTNVVTYSDVASKLTPDSYSGLTFAEANLGFGSRSFYAIHHKPGTDFFAEIVPGTGTSSAIFDLKPMSWTGPTAGGPASPGAAGYFGLAWATGILAAGAPYADESIYYLRTDAGNHTQFGVMVPALTGASADTLDLTTAVGSFGATGYTTLAFSTDVVGNNPAKQFYYLRQDTITGNTILGRLNPSLVAGTRTISDIANLGGVFDTLNFAADATGPAGAWGTSQFYVSGALVANAQSVSFAAIPNRNVGDTFSITPTASSGLDLDVTVVSGPATVQTTGVSGATPLSLRIFTVTTTGNGIVTLQARQAGQAGVPVFAANSLRQSFQVGTGIPPPPPPVVNIPIVTNASTVQGTVGSTFSFTLTGSDSPTSYDATPLPAGLSLNSTTGVISGTPTVSGTTTVNVMATNSAGTSGQTLTITVVAAGSGTPAPGSPTITSAPTAPGTVGSSFNTVISATGSPTSFSASGLPAGLSINTVTGAITGTPTQSGTFLVTIRATNANGTTSSTLEIMIAGQSSSRIVNFSARALSGAGSQTLIVGFVVSGNGKSLLIRAVGPTLQGQGIVNFLADPLLTLFNTGGAMTTNDDWQTTRIAEADGAMISATAARIGAFSLPTGSKDAALLLVVNDGPHTTGLVRPNGATGIALTEIYDTDITSGAKLMNVSARMFITPGEGTLMAGLVIGGGSSKKLLIRGIGPTLASLGVTGALSDPIITVYSAGAVVASNDNWEQGSSPSSEIVAVSARVGAFALPAGTKDAALLVTLPTGSYTVHVTGAANATGVALVEVYDAD